ncbi:MAG: cytochrome b/b6, partial [Proteobacteria bacterium]|nr:cytochrome b/b6 [Pseudomonadota bacterium]
RYRPTYKIFFWILVVVCFLLGYCGSQPTDKAVLQLGGKTILDISGLGLLLTIYYFAHFLVVLPLLGLFEKPKAEPASIADAVLARSGH